jgi:hypothetical protein
MNLGAALSILGARESGTARLEEAVGAYDGQGCSTLTARLD